MAVVEAPVIGEHPNLIVATSKGHRSLGEVLEHR
jgi:hypothetical protein